MKINKRFKIVGSRVIKTGVAVFLTAFICQSLQLTIAFAVITAIVTIEPTAFDSIKKGMVRFPASLIGACYAVGFTYLLGHGAISYTLAATLTIFTCNKLRLEAGILVATLTAVAMIPTIHDHFLLNFVERLGTTMIGLVVSTAVNIVVLPPKFQTMITNQIDELNDHIASLLELISKGLIIKRSASAKEVKDQYELLTKEVNKVLQLCQYQQEELRFHRHTMNQMRRLVLEKKKIQSIQKLLCHFGNLLHIRLHNLSLTDEMITIIKKITYSCISNLRKQDGSNNQADHLLIEEIKTSIWGLEVQEEQLSQTVPQSHFTPETILLFEILSIYYVIEEQKNWQMKGRKIIKTSPGE